MRNGKRGHERVRLKSIDKVERTGPNTYEVEATFCVDDRPRRGRGTHEVDGHWEVVDGKRHWVREHQARDPRR